MNRPYGREKLVDAVITSPDERKDLIQEAKGLKALMVADRFLSDCEMLATGAFTPAEGFMNRDEIDSIIRHLHLPNNLIWGVPITLLITEQEASSIRIKERVSLLDKEKRIIAIMEVRDKFKYPKDTFCKEIFKTTDDSHPGVKAFLENPDIFLAGPIKLIERPKREATVSAYCIDPSQTRKEFKKRKWATIAAFQTRNPIHRAHEYLIKCALECIDGMLIHPLVGETKPDDIPAETRIKCYEALIENYFNPDRIFLSALPAFMHYAGPREALNHAIMRKNYGCTHFIIGRDHAGVGNYYGTYEAQDMLSLYAEKIGITPLKFEHAYYCRICKEMVTSKTCPHSQDHHLHLSGTKVRTMIKEKKTLPLEFTRKEVAEVLLRRGN